MRVLYRFGKQNWLRFVSHLDLQRYMQRALNRTNLPIAFSQGFNPHPVMSFASALAMGWTSEYEVIDIKLSRDVDKECALAEFRRALPPDLPVYDARLTDDLYPAQMALVKMADYRVTPAPEALGAVARAAEEYMRGDCVMAVRKTKTREVTVNIRALTKALACDGGALTARLMLTEQETVKPDVLMDALCKLAGIETPAFRIHRLALIGVSDTGEQKPIMEL